MSASLLRMVRNALTMMMGTLASRILGLAREIITAAFFGASRSLDAFYVAYTLANLARQLLAEGALSAAFVPVFAQALEKDGKKRASSLARQAMAVLLMAGGLVVVLGIIFSPWLVAIMAPGFDPDKAALAVSLTRWMFPYLLFVSIAALAMGVLNSMDCFFVPAVAPALANVAYIIVIMTYMGVRGLVWGVLLGGFLQMALQWFWSAKLDVSLIPEKPDRKDEDLRRMILLFLPYAAGLSLNQVNPIISRILGSYLQDGSISVLNYANRVIQLPLGLVVIAISQAVLPELSRCVLKGDDVFRDTVRDALRFSLFAILPITVGACLVASPVIHVLFYRGAFDNWAWLSTSSALTMYALGLPGMACSTVLMRALYAKSLPRCAVIVTLTSVISNLILSLILMKPLGFSGLALAVSIAFTLSSIVGLVLLDRYSGGSVGVFDISWVGKMSISLAAMAGGIWGSIVFFPYPDTCSMWLRASWLLVVTIIGATFYSTASYLLRCPEWNWLLNAVKRKKTDKKDGNYE